MYTSDRQPQAHLLPVRVKTGLGLTLPKRLAAHAMRCVSVLPVSSRGPPPGGVVTSMALTSWVWGRRVSRYTHALACSGEGLSMNRNMAICRGHQAGGSMRSRAFTSAGGSVQECAAALMTVELMVIVMVMPCPSTL